MAVTMIGRPSWPYRPARGRHPQDRDLPDQAQSDQGPAQEVIGEMAWLLRDTRSSMFLGGGVLSAITIAHLLVGAARLARRRTQMADTWTYIAAAVFLIWTVVVLLGL